VEDYGREGFSVVTVEVELSSGEDHLTSSFFNREYQEHFFDEHAPLYPWPRMLRSAGLNRVFKPREVMWKSAFQSLGLMPGEKVLDVGCSSGIWLDRLRQQFGVDGVGVDISANSLRDAVRASSKDIAYVGGDISYLPLQDGLFDVVFCLDVLEHVADQDRCLREMVRVLKPGGRLLLWTLNRKQRYTWNWWLGKMGIDIYERVAHDPALFPNATEVQNELESAGTTVERLEFFNAFFTLALDEIIMLTVSIFERFHLFNRDGKFTVFVGRLFLKLTDIFSRNLTGFLHWLDRPWIRRGYSNGFLVIVRKRGNVE
jgi:ubiquinone/menaquinone biosynthesis C-methylase UbiE